MSGTKRTGTGPDGPPPGELPLERLPIAAGRHLSGRLRRAPEELRKLSDS